MIATKKKEKRLIATNIRLPKADRDRIREIAKEQSNEEMRVTEADIIREAVSLFLSKSST
jgi:hypothetical protein